MMQLVTQKQRQLLDLSGVIAGPAATGRRLGS
jgi:hypothetical protein